MIVKSCSVPSPAPIPTPIKTFTYEEILKKEGVYKEANSHPESGIRLISFTGPAVPCLLFHHKRSGQLEVAGPHWKTVKFVEVKADVCFEIKEK